MFRLVVVVMFYLLTLACSNMQDKREDVTTSTTTPQTTYNYLTQEDLNYIDLMIPHDDADVFIIYRKEESEAYLKELIALFKEKLATIHLNATTAINIPDTHMRTNNLYIHYMGDYRYEVNILNVSFTE